MFSVEPNHHKNDQNFKYMKVLNSIDEFEKTTQPVVVTMGSFDGVHQGHQLVLNQLKNIADKNKALPVVISFSPHPRIYFNPETDFKLLTTDSEKAYLLQQQGIDYFILQRFDSDFARQTAEDFVRKLSENLNMKHLLIGYDHRFGKDRKGDFKHIQSLESTYDFTTHQADILKKNDTGLSSTLIRNQLLQGDVKTANEFLGYPYFITGRVVKGNQLGQKLGFPTANIEVHMPDDQSRMTDDSFYDSSAKYKLIPQQGVYLVQSKIDGKDYYGMMNIGFRPTIDGKKQTKEVHFFDLDKDLYNKVLRISFLERLRDEQKFPSLDALQKQLRQDAKTARNLIEKYSNQSL